VDVIATAIEDVLIFKPKVFGDSRGFFMETFRQQIFEEQGLAYQFVQDNHSFSRQGVLRGLHYQLNNPQGKLVRVVAGEVYDVAVDIRQCSATFGKYVGVTLSAENKHQLWVPPGFAHGFLVLSDSAELVYKCTDYYDPASERSILWSDETIGIDWPITDTMAVEISEKDAAASPLIDAEIFE